MVFGVGWGEFLPLRRCEKTKPKVSGERGEEMAFFREANLGRAVTAVRGDLEKRTQWRSG
jgi:hypothetical protein